MNVQRLHPEAILKFWGNIEPEIQKALDHGVGETPIFNWFKNLVNHPDHYHLWVVFDGEEPVNVTMTKFNDYDTHRSLHVITTTSVGKGKWSVYKEAHHAIEEFAKFHKCRRIEQWGRDMWEHVLPRLEGAAGERYEKTYVVMSMELDYEQDVLCSDSDGDGT